MFASKNKCHYDTCTKKVSMTEMISCKGAQPREAN